MCLFFIMKSRGVFKIYVTDVDYARVPNILLRTKQEYYLINKNLKLKLN